MGGALLTVKGQSEEEAKRELKRVLREAEDMGLFEVHKRVVKYNPDRKVWEGYVGVHT